MCQLTNNNLDVTVTSSLKVQIVLCEFVQLVLLGMILRQPLTLLMLWLLVPIVGYVTQTQVSISLLHE